MLQIFGWLCKWGDDPSNFIKINKSSIDKIYLLIKASYIQGNIVTCLVIPFYLEWVDTKERKGVEYAY